MSLRYGFLALLGAGLTFAVPARAQVVADIHIGGYPVAGHVVVGAPRVIRPLTRVIVVERVGRRAPDWYWRRGWRPVTVWYDGGRFVHPSSTWRPWYREVVVLQRGGRFILHDWAWGRFQDPYWIRGGGRYEPYVDRLHERRYEGRRWDDGNRGWDGRREDRDGRGRPRDLDDGRGGYRGDRNWSD